MKVLITGGSGLLGGALGRRFARDHDVTPWSFTRSDGPFASVDLRDASEVGSVMRTCAPDVVIHAAAYRDPDFCEQHPDEAHRLNVAGTRHVLEAAGAWDAWFVFISTDYVFDGANPPYSEDSPVGPVNVYGQTKADAEQIVRSYAGHLIVRIPILYGPGARPGNDLAGALRAAVEADTPQIADDTARRTPTLTDDVAGAIGFLLERDLSGTFHVSGPDVLTRYAMTQTVAELLGRSADHVQPGAGQTRPAKRPRAALLDTTKLRQAGFGPFTSFETGARHLLGI